MLKICCENVRKTVPLVHNITNYVTVNDVANVLLACGGSPIMSDEPEDVDGYHFHLRGSEHQYRNPASQTSIEADACWQERSPMSWGIPFFWIRWEQVLLHFAPIRQLKLMKEHEADSDPRKYFRDQDSGAWKRHHEGGGR